MFAIAYIICFLTICLHLFSSTNTFAQDKEIHFEHLTVEDGLPNNSVWSITQDHLGFMWFTTSSGLVKYDGYKITTYQPDENDSNSIYNGDPATLYEDQSKNLWITLTNGLSLYNRESDNFTNYLNDPDRNSNNIFYHITEDHTGRLWIGSGTKGLLKLVKNPEKLKNHQNIIEKSYVHDPTDSTSITSNCIFTVFEDNSGTIWLASDEGLCKYHRETDNFTTYKVKREETFYNLMFAIFEDSKNNLWVGTMGGGLAKFDREKCEFEFTTFTSEGDNPSELPREKKAPNTISRSIIEDDDGTFWIPTVGGLINFNPITDRFKRFVHDPANPHSLSVGGDGTHMIYRDHSDVKWLSTTIGGINKFSERKNFKHVVYDQVKQNGLSNRLVTCIYEDNERIIWIGTSDGVLNKYNRKTGDFTHYSFISSEEISNRRDYVRCIIEDKDGVLWIGMHFGGLYRFEKSNGTFTSYKYDPQNPKGISNNSVTSIVEDESGSLWIGGPSGVLNEFNKNTGEFYHYLKFESESVWMSNDSTRAIYDMYMDNEGNIWFVSGRGRLNRFDKATKQRETYEFDKLSVDFTLFSIYEDKQNRIWIGRESGGLLRFDKQSKSYKIYRISDGLPDETVGAILEDDNGYLWMRTGTAICKFNPDNETFKVYKLSQGYQVFSCWNAWKSKITGEMYFSGDDGFYIFHPDSVKDNLILPKIVLTDFRIFDESVQIGKDTPLKKHISIAEEIILEHWQNDFTLEFAALHYTNPARNQHKYKLSGYQDNWRTADANRLAKYTNMSPGEYIFKVIGSNSDGIWNEEEATISIIILPPWWATTWAYLAYALLIIWTIYFVWRMQLKRVRIKHDYEMSKFEAEKLHEVDEMKSRFFANLSHEFRTPLTLIFGPAKDILDKSKDVKIKENAGIIKRNATRLYGLVNQLLDLSKLEVGKMKLEVSEQNIMPLLKGYVLSFSSLAERKKITLNFNSIEENLNLYFDKDKVEKIINNLLSNAFKFTPEGGKIDFTVEKLIDNAEIRIADNGIGIEKERKVKIFDRFYQVDGSHTRASEGTGIGLALTKELVELHKGKIEVESEEGKGTTLKILLPLGKDHLKPEEIIEKDIPEETEVTIEETELIPETENKKEKSDIDILLETNKPLLLIVEDNSDVRKYIISHLEKDYKIKDAVDGENGLQEALKHIPDLIISDIMMPKMDGFELCEKLKTDERTSHIPVILLTAKATNQDKIEGLETGADDYIMKPFDANVLKVRIKNLIEQRRKLRKHFKKEGLSVEMFAGEVSMSRRNLDRKLVALTGEAPSDLIRRVRLMHAAKLITQNFGNISEIALEVGFSNPAYFSKCFREQFGIAPSEYNHSHQK
jgi:signal transduction histidine kinase/ligand-binding sensor domain-containing protein/DNA-binding response OmpR family regulator